MTNLDRLSGGSGMKIIDDTSLHSVSLQYFIPREDTVISVCAGIDYNGNAVDFKATQNWDGTLLATDYCIVPLGFKITSIQLTSGSIQCY